MPRRIPGLLLWVGLLAACAGAEPRPPSATSAVDMHNSRNSLDWSGVYEGVVTCQDSPGALTRLTLDRDGGFELSRRSLVRGARPNTATGRFAWQPDGTGPARLRHVGPPIGVARATRGGELGVRTGGPTR